MPTLREETSTISSGMLSRGSLSVGPWEGLMGTRPEGLSGLLLSSLFLVEESWGTSTFRVGWTEICSLPLVTSSHSFLPSQSPYQVPFQRSRPGIQGRDAPMTHPFPSWVLGRGEGEGAQRCPSLSILWAAPASHTPATSLVSLQETQ